MEFLFKNISSQNPLFGIISVTNVTRQVLPAQRNRFLSVPGRSGVYDFGCDYDMLVIDVSFVTRGTSHTDLRNKHREISLWLECHELFPLIFQDEPDKFYLARPISPVTTRQIHLTAFHTVTFGVPDVFAQSLDFSLASHTGTNLGTLPAPVRILATLTASGPSFRITYVQKNQYIELLRPVSSGQLIEIDTGRRILRQAGIDRRADVAVESEYFTLAPKEIFTLTTTVAATISTEWRERWS